MKKLITLAAVVGVTSLLAACSSHSKNETIDGSYILVSANEQPLPQSIPPVINLSVNDDLTQVKVSGKMCNVFNGDTNYQNGVLQGNFMMTRAMCSEPVLNALDTQISQMFAQGVKVEKVDGKLVFTSGNNTLVYQPLQLTSKDNTK
ncbi:heat shock protein HslJ [Orbus hercynius]|uniref:Heat shock protein HslJ n=1 Tax=Orbus hercynius TaxID=593135 RepID=A0A495RHJ4_9GAMM|nr:META domain-containing protein [Orbus hercynius]RKS86895.1 heat shock protein HslJ [Orbus hercynius]